MHLIASSRQFHQSTIKFVDNQFIKLNLSMKAIIIYQVFYFSYLNFNLILIKFNNIYINYVDD